MAVVQWTGLTTAMKGKLKGSVLQAGAGGQIIRSNNQFNQRGNPRWSGSKLNVGQTVQVWKGLSPTDRLTWAAATVNFPTVDRYGNTHYSSPYTLHMRLNTPLLYHTGSTNSAAPTPQVFPSLGTLAASANDSPSVVIYWTYAMPANFMMIVNACACISPGRSASKGLYTFITRYTSTSAVSLDITSEFIDRFGQVQANAVIYFKVQLLSTISGQLSPVYLTSAYT